jgi:hypothetical protein
MIIFNMIKSVQLINGPSIISVYVIDYLRSLELIATAGVLLSFVCVFLSLFRLKDCILALREPRSPISIE